MPELRNRNRKMLEQLRGDLRLKNLPDDLVRDLEMAFPLEGERRKYYLDMKRAASQWLKEKRDKRRNAKRRKQPGEPSQQGTIAARLQLVDPLEVKRSQVLSQVLARLAVVQRTPAQPAVLEYRHRYLGGRTLTPAEAWAFLSSPALAYLFWSGKTAVPAVGHRARILQRDFDLRIPPTGGGPAYFMEVELRHGRTRKRHTVWIPPGNLRTLRCWNEAGTEQETEVVTVSPLGQLAELATSLSQRFPWSEAAAAWFALTGEAPETPSLRGGASWHLAIDHTRALIRLEVQPWVSAATVSSIFLDLRRRVLAGRVNRPLTADRLELVDFVSERRPSGASWRDMLSEWNRTHPERRYPKKGDIEQGVLNFQRDYKQTYRLLIHPGYQPSGRSPVRPG